MSLLINLGLFLVVFLPAAALASMVLAGVLGDRVATSPDWDVGWNPILWLVMTMPWLLPTVAVVPVLHFLGKGIAGRRSRSAARRALPVLSPVLYVLAVLVLWGPGNFRLEFVLPVALAGVLYGAVQRIDGRS